MDSSGATIIGAALTSLVALGVAIVSLMSSQKAAVLLARQNAVGHDLVALSDLTYQVVALSVAASKSKALPAFDEKLGKAKAVAVELDGFRRRHRYTLPFLFEPLWYLKGVPLYFEHCRKDLNAPQVQVLQEEATELRQAIDKVVERYFFRGNAPGFFATRRLMRRCRKLEKAFKAGAPKEDQSLHPATSA